MKGLSKKQLLKENQELREENARLRQEVELLRQKMDLLIRRVFGRSSEKLDANQLDLFLMASENEAGKVDASSLEEADPRHEPRARRDARCRERWPADLPVVEEIIDPKEVQKAPEHWRLIGAEVSEQLDYEPGRFLRRRLVRRKYVRRGDPEAVPLIAALPPSLQERERFASVTFSDEATGWGIITVARHRFDSSKKKLIGPSNSQSPFRHSSLSR